MISDVLFDAVAEINAYLDRDDSPYAEHPALPSIVAVRDAMEAVRVELDNDDLVLDARP